MRWLARRVLGVDDRTLDAARYQRLQQRIGELSKGDSSNALNLAPGIAAIALIPFWQTLAKHFSVAWRFAFEASFGLCVIVYVWWLLRRRYTRHGWQALRDLGYADVCGRCGYDLSRQPQPNGQCPECGEPFSQFHPAQTVATGQP